MPMRDGLTPFCNPTRSRENSRAECLGWFSRRDKASFRSRLPVNRLNSFLSARHEDYGAARRTGPLQLLPKWARAKRVAPWDSEIGFWYKTAFGERPPPERRGSVPSSV